MKLYNTWVYDKYQVNYYLGHCLRQWPQRGTNVDNQFLRLPTEILPRKYKINRFGQMKPHLKILGMDNLHSCKTLKLRLDTICTPAKKPPISKKKQQLSRNKFLYFFFISSIERRIRPFFYSCNYFSRKVFILNSDFLINFLHWTNPSLLRNIDPC